LKNHSQLYKAVKGRRTLWNAWIEVAKKASSSKAPQTREEARIFSQGLPRNIERIGRKLSKSQFVFLPQKGIILRTSSGKKRPVVVAPIESRIVQRAILDTVQLIPEIKEQLTSGHNFGGVPGPEFGVPNAIYAATAAMVDRPYFLRTDIKQFFDHVPKALAIKEVLNHSGDPRFDSLFAQAVETEIDDAAKHGADIRLFPLYEEGVAQGSCLSPLLCNLLLTDFDLSLNTRGIVAIRYIDDILILGKNKRAVFKAFSSAQSILQKMNLECYDPRKPEDRKKAEHGEISRGFGFLGCDVKPGAIRPSAVNRSELLEKVNAHFRFSLSLIHDPQVAFKRHATYAETLSLVSRTVQGWANTFGFCTDDRIMGSIDTEISIALRKYSSAISKLVRTMNETDRRRAFGVFSIADRIRPVGGQLMRSLK
jgi:RNA-directed DNA polymerase